MIRFPKIVPLLLLVLSGSLVVAQSPDAAYEIRTVVIDPGHGGRDQGCSGKHSDEKHITLGIARELQTQLQAKYPNLLVILTRDADRFVPLSKRAAVANQNRADLFISIHCNAIKNHPKVRGSETYVMGLHASEENLAVAKRENAVIKLEENFEQTYGFDPDSPEAHIVMSMMQNAYLDQSIQFAELVESRIAASGRRSRGVKQAGFVVLRETTMPGVLVETGFLTNTTDEDFLRTLAGQRATAAALAGAFGDYKRQMEHRPPPTAVDLNPVDHTLYAISEPDAGTTKEAKPAGSVPTAANSPKQSRTMSNDVEPSRTTSNDVKVVNVALNDLASTTNAAGIQFHVQLAASRVKLDTQRGRWTRTGFAFREIRESGYWKYQTTPDGSYERALEKQRLLRQRGFKDCFLVAYRADEKIPVERARKLVSSTN